MQLRRIGSILLAYNRNHQYDERSWVCNIHIEETKDKKRIEWCKFIDCLSNGDSAVFASFDNVFHNLHDMMFFIKYCSKMDIRIIFLSDELDTHDRLFPERRTADTLDLINHGGTT